MSRDSIWPVRMDQPGTKKVIWQLKRETKHVRGVYAASTLALSNAFEEQETSYLPKFKRPEGRVPVHGAKARSKKGRAFISMATAGIDQSTWPAY